MPTDSLHLLIVDIALLVLIILCIISVYKLWRKVDVPVIDRRSITTETVIPSDEIEAIMRQIIRLHQDIDRLSIKMDFVIRQQEQAHYIKSGNTSPGDLI